MNNYSIGAFAASGALLLALVGCSSSGGVDGDQELLVWDTGLLGKTLESGEPDLENSFLDQAAADFEEQNPGVTITVVQQGGDISSNGAQFQAAAIAGNGPDVRIQFAGGPTLSYEQFFTDLTDVIPTETVDAMSGWTATRAGYDPNGAILGMPYGSGLYFTVFTDNAKLEAAGMDPSEVPSSWEELMDLGQQYREASGEPAFLAANLEGYVGAWVVGGLIAGELGESSATDMYNGDISLDDDAFLTAYEAWAEFGASGLTNPDAGQKPNSESTPGFVGGTGAYYIAGSWENQNMIDAFGDDVGSFFLPVLADSEFPAAVSGGPSVAVSITNYSDKQELAGEFLNFLAQPEVQDRYVELYQTESSNHVDGDVSVIQNRLLQEQAEQLQSAGPVVFPFDSVMPQSVIDLFYRLNSSTFLGTTTPEDAVSQLQAANEAEIAGR